MIIIINSVKTISTLINAYNDVNQAHVPADSEFFERGALNCISSGRFLVLLKISYFDNKYTIQVPCIGT